MQVEIHDNAVDHGWWETDRDIPELLMLAVCELSEAMEEYRSGHDLYWTGEDGKPEGISVELADCVIRILDVCEHLGIKMSQVIVNKHQYNLGRPYRHGGKIA